MLIENRKAVGKDKMEQTDLMLSHPAACILVERLPLGPVWITPKFRRFLRVVLDPLLPIKDTEGLE